MTQIIKLTGGKGYGSAEINVTEYPEVKDFTLLNKRDKVWYSFDIDKGVGDKVEGKFKTYSLGLGCWVRLPEDADERKAIIRKAIEVKTGVVAPRRFMNAKKALVAVKKLAESRAYKLRAHQADGLSDYLFGKEDALVTQTRKAILANANGETVTDTEVDRPAGI